MTPQEEYKADLLAVWARLKAHPKTTWFVLGLLVASVFWLIVL